MRYLLYSLCAIAIVLLFAVKTVFVPEMTIDQSYSKFILPVVITDRDTYKSTSSSSVSSESPTSSDESPLILLWNHIADSYVQTCPVEWQCRITTNRSLIDESSAVVILLNSFAWKQLPENLIRRPDQYYVMVEFESPEQQFVDMTGREEFFNLTMTYRRDSDVVFPYGDIIHHDSPKTEMELWIDARRLVNATNGKRKLIAWFASNCRTWSNRLLVAQRLEQYVGVDTYGRCGNLSCPKTDGSWRSSMVCYDMLTRDYKFYLSLENSICQDYITEKYFKIMRLTTVIPIVFERKQIVDFFRNEEEIASAANSSFIAVDDFESIEQLATYLKYLDGNTTAYLEYFEWRKKYRVIMDRTRKVPACELCRIVKEKKPRIVKDIHYWWYKSAKCHSYK